MSISKYIESLQARGQYWFSYQMLVAETDKSQKAVERSLSRLREHGTIASPRRGFYIIVPPEYRAAGCLPATWFIDDLMKFSNEHYYVALLSAAELYGATHHHPQELQVIGERSLRPLECGRVRIRFFAKRYIEKTPTTSHKVRTGYMRISTPEATALDLVRYSFELGGLDSVAVVIAELSETMKPRELIKAAECVELSVVQRLGFILDKTPRRSLSDPLSKWLLQQRPRLVLLSTDRSPDQSQINERWRLKVNDDIELEA
ncbi:MAG: type IV toxin-antitoxin system AbiEi family antitoxin [Candidatus Obscuribacterales bacterium]|nr:type IV toxin-antitoxin system AbiEi family antitoxin [Candidatus Obscuribacterales bacterium]